MKFLKGFALAILSLLLFLSLAVFGLAFMLKSTVLNADFVVKEVNRLDIATLAGDFIEEQVSGMTTEEEQFLEENLPKIIAALEPQLKEQLDGAIRSGYDYLLGGTDKLNIAISLETLKADLKDSLWQSVEDSISSAVATALSPDLMRPYLEDHYQEFAALIPAQYLPAEARSLSGDKLKLYLVNTYLQIIQQIPESEMEQLAAQLEAQLQPYFDQYYEQLMADVPDEYTVDESSIPDDVMPTVNQAREIIGYFKTGYYVLIAFMVLLVGLIILIDRNVRGTTRRLGVNFLIYGVLEIAGVLVTRAYIPALPLGDLPASLQTWLTGLLSDLMSPALIFGIGLAAVGAVLLVVSFVVKPRAAEA